MRLVLELTKADVENFKKVGQKVQDIRKKLRNTFAVRIINNGNPKRKNKKPKAKKAKKK